MKPPDLREEIALDLDWDRLRAGIATLEPSFRTFRARVEAYLDQLDA